MRNLQEGTRVLVSNGGTLKERTYLFTTEEGLYVCVHNADTEKYENWEYFRVWIWSVLETLSDWFEDIFEYWESVLVSNGGEVFRPRIFLGRVGDRILTVHKQDECRFESGKLNFRTALWNEARV